MNKKLQKIYCFADESGQDTAGDMFLVAVALKDAQEISTLRQSMEKNEYASGKHKRKWSKTPNSVKKKYLRLLLENKLLRETIFYSIYHQSKDYTPLMALTIAKSIQTHARNNYSATIIIDGLLDAQTESVRRQLKKLKIHYNRIRGMKDEQDACLRLADSMAGFIRDSAEGRNYTEELFAEFIKRKIIREI